MRIPKYLSPTSIKLFFSDREEFYIRYLADERPPRPPQTRPMSVGGAFDAYVKSFLFKKLFGKTDPQFELQTIFEAQVEEQNRDWARIHGAHAFNCYRYSGALADLMLELEQAVHDPRFEFTVENRVAHEDFADGVPLLGKPDIYFVTKNRHHVILDWKVNGYCSQSNTSPKPGYIKIRDGWIEGSAPHSRSHNTMHKDCQPMMIDGLSVNLAGYFEDVAIDWANQMIIYAWILGEQIGAQFIVGIDQLACKGSGTEYPLIRIASHRARVSCDYQKVLNRQIKYMWTRINDDGYILTDLSREECAERCAVLNDRHRAFEGGDAPKEKWFNDISNTHRKW